MQDIRKGYVLLANHYHKIFLERVSKDYEIHIEDLWLYSPEEIVHLCTTKKIISPKELEQRKVMMVEVQSKSERIIFSGKQAQEFYQHLQEETLETTEFKGTIASMGKTQGRVVIVLKTHDLLRVERGDILVSSMTRPEMTVAMHKAAAFVTDEGGITSHAAIVARELHKPCVIGTKIATKILKDGDLVEVDANKGIIKILRKNS
ncbi:hypothetical protein HYV86_06715 [Candidatus Woesearchaeota archaeon]|nr:hypothetical protein [Candidatus Woesearchaeota archaeon]